MTISRKDIKLIVAGYLAGTDVESYTYAYGQRDLVRQAIRYVKDALSEEEDQNETQND